MKRICCNQFQNEVREVVTVGDLFGHGPTDPAWPIEVRLSFTEGSYGSNVAVAELRKGEGCCHTEHRSVTVEKVTMGEGEHAHSYLKILWEGAWIHSVSDPTALRGMANVLLKAAEKFEKES